MAKGNGRISAKVVGEWFSALTFAEQAKYLGEWQELHGKARQSKIGLLKRELAVLENGSGSGHATPVAKRGRKKGSAKVKYRDPKSGETWSGRGRMARWLAEKVGAGEKQEKYLV